MIQSADWSLDVHSLDDFERGGPVSAYTITNENGAELRTMNYGGIILSLRVPDREGTLEDIVLGFDDYEKYRSDAYLSAAPYFGAIIGRYANRINRGCFQLDGTTHQLSTNQGPNHLHGGRDGFDKQLWSADPFEDEQGSGIRYAYTSPDTEEGYPGRLAVAVTYRLTNDNDVIVTYGAETTKATPVNLTQHSYFNLAGAAAEDVLDHRLSIAADSFTPVDSSLIPTGEIRSVNGTPFDFRTPTRIGARINANAPQLKYARGYDHNFVLNREGAGSNSSLHTAARAYEPQSGRVMTVSTTEPGLQFYSGNFLDGTLDGKNGGAYEKHSGFCLETQHFPDSPNHPGFPSTILHPGETYQSRTVFSFSTV